MRENDGDEPNPGTLYGCMKKSQDPAQLYMLAKNVKKINDRHNRNTH
jgi:hypothetical protein